MRRNHRNAVIASLFVFVLLWGAGAVWSLPAKSFHPPMRLHHDSWPQAHPSMFPGHRTGGTEKACGRVEDALWAMGWPQASIPTMVAISWAESGCRTEATHVGRGEWSVGPMQINIARAAHPWVRESCARDYECSARAARDIWKAKGFRAWAAYLNGRWKQFFRRGN